jgi:hypothetical protein
MKLQSTWIKSKWNRDDLNDKTAEFRIFMQDEKDENKLVPVSGNGRFRTIENPQELMRIDIVVTRQKAYGQYEDIIFHCPQKAEPLIKRNDEGSKFDYSIFQF